MKLLPAGDKSATTPTLLERLLAGGAHLSSFVAPFLAPLLIWLVTFKWLPYVAHHARQALVTHLLTLLAIGLLGVLAVVVFLLGLDGTLSVPPAGGGIELLYLGLFVLLVGAAFLAWLIGQIHSVLGAWRAIQGKPARTFWRKRR